MSTIGANWGRVGVTRFGAGLRANWGRVGVTWSPIMSRIGANWDRRVGVTRFGACGSPIMSTIGAIGAGWVSLLHGLRS